ncbi:hypothetical protein LTR78_004035 [Recurvomyces mirabilis]|uniref:VASt domain-containing protein n=1 Tax=Recurvomyces mirabilis TaxID=574656 RepID=A0AAE0WR59_9PEZI|nr:hypothetical protein LTR78_004035 [Recurvomyces mirabilis]KAK5153827.1 hypothetical protein LTS14_007046 [Recurvomyces mirabilis]
MPTTDLRAPSPRGPLSKLRRNKNANGSTTSLQSSTGDTDESTENARGLRGSIDKGKERIRKSIDERRGSGDASAKRLSSLLPRRKRSPNKGSGSPTRALSGLSLDPGNGSHFLSGNHSNASFDDSGHSSLLTDDNNSDHEGHPVRPTLSPHQSHAGYLTLSSPEFNKHSQSVITVDAIASPESKKALASTTSVPHIIEPFETEPFPQITPPERSVSPGTKLKDAFKISRKQPASDADSIKSSSGGGGIGALFRPKSRRGSLSSQVAVEPAKPEEPVVAPDPDISVIGGEPLAQVSQLDTIKSEGRPETPTQPSRGRSRINTETLPATPPNLVETPTTLVTPPTPTLPKTDALTFPNRNAVTSDAQGASPPAKPLSSVDSIRHRRAQSAKLPGVPSRLSNAIAAPLTPTAEEAKTPGGTLTQPTSATGFFSTFVTAASKAAEQLSQNIAAQQKGRPTSPSSAQDSTKDIGSLVDTKQDSTGLQSRAIDTIGKGDLSLDQLGISDTNNRSPMPSTPDLPQQDIATQNGNTTQKAEEDAAARAVSAAYEKPLQKVISQAQGRPPSIASHDRLTLDGEQTPLRSGAEADGLKRSGSVRSKISAKARRHRASSATTGTGNTIAAALQSSHAALANPSINGSHRLTGFAVASSKRNKDFHQLFRSVPEDDYLIEDYSAALQRDILLHGRLYVSEGHICFSSNILGWVTNLVVGFDEVVSVEKKSTAVIFPNAIVIQTLQARNTFASLVARDSTYELIIGIWKINHPNLKSSLNGVALDDAGTGDKTEVADPEGSGEETADGSDDEVYDEDDDEDDVGSFTDGGMNPSVAPSEAGDHIISRKTSAIPINGLQHASTMPAKTTETAEAAVAAATTAADFPGPATHAQTECSESGEHYDKLLMDTTIPAPLGKVYSLLFGPASSPFMRKWLIDDQKSRELQLPDDKIGLDNDHKTMSLEYIKPLNAPVGPKQTKCLTTYNVMAFDLEKAVSIDCSTQTPDVPSGNVFTTKTRYCLMWGPGNSTRLVATCTVEWTGKSWLKSVIDSGAAAGQTEYLKSLVAAVKAVIPARPVAKVPGKKGARRRRTTGEPGAKVEREAIVIPEQKAASWGALEPLHQILEPLIAIVRPFVTSQTIIAVLFVLLVYTWLVPPYRSAGGVGPPGYRSPERLVAYDELWRREESELWDWLEDRVGLDHLASPALAEQQRGRQRDAGVRGIGKKLEDERMSERQMDDAIKVTEERLSTLKEAVAKKNKRAQEKRQKS